MPRKKTPKPQEAPAGMTIQVRTGGQYFIDPQAPADSGSVEPATTGEEGEDADT